MDSIGPIPDIGEIDQFILTKKGGNPKAIPLTREPLSVRIFSSTSESKCFSNHFELSFFKHDPKLLGYAEANTLICYFPFANSALTPGGGVAPNPPFATTASMPPFAFMIAI